MKPAGSMKGNTNGGWSRGSNADGCSPIAMKISLTFIAVLAEVSIKSRLLSSAYACASW